MASIRPSRSPAPPSPPTSAETWAVRIAFGLMIAGMAGFVIYDLVAPGPARASSSDDEPTIEEPAADVSEATEAPAATTTRRPPRFGKTPKVGRTRPPSTRPSSPLADRAEVPTSRPDPRPEPEDEPRRDDASNRRSGLRAFLGSPGSRLRPTGVDTPTPSERIAPRREEPEPPPEPTPPPAAEPEPTEPEQPEAQPEEQPAENAEEQPAEEGEQPVAETEEEAEESEPVR